MVGSGVPSHELAACDSGAPEVDQPTLQVLNHFFMLVGPPGAAGSLGARTGPGSGYLGWLLACPCGALCCWLLGCPCGA